MKTNSKLRKIQYTVDESAAGIAEGNIKYAETLWLPPGATGQPQYAADDCAESYYAEHDDREYWHDGGTLRFSLFELDGTPLGVFDVTMEMVPSFWSRPVKGQVAK